MAETFKLPVQSNPGAASITDLFTATTQVVGRINVANRSATPTAFRISLAPGGAADDVSQYIAYDTPIGGNDVYTSVTFTLGSGDKIRVYATLATLTFTLARVEIT